MRCLECYLHQEASIILCFSNNINKQAYTSKSIIKKYNFIRNTMKIINMHIDNIFYNSMLL
jgi:hypothetical protein